MKYELSSKRFDFEWESDIKIQEPTIIQVPRFVTPNGYSIELKNAEKIQEKGHQIYVRGFGGVSSIQLRFL
jgi:hypothetical protein